jgi:UDP-N-acetylglucosamine 2-epimerase (non-hydrolysing)
MSEIFFKEFGLPAPNFDLDVGSGSASFQISEILRRLEKIFLAHKFDLVIVYGDTNSTFAGALCARKMGLKLAHVESGLRSFDICMPEEVNRILTDDISDYLFAPTRSAVDNLAAHHVLGKVFYTGDLSAEIINQAQSLLHKSSILNQLNLKPKSYVLFTMHRVENTDSKENIISIIKAFELLSQTEIVFPIHPRTKKILTERNLYTRLEGCKNVRLISPVGYLDFISLLKNSNKVVTDSGGVQKEAYLLSIPCITIRKNTEWVETVDTGWNILTGTDTAKIVEAIKRWQPKEQTKPIFGDGNTSSIIKDLIISFPNMEKGE